MCLCIGLAAILTNTNTTFQVSRKPEGIRKFVLEKLSYFLVYGNFNKKNYNEIHC
jgi:hypothetical protein